MIYLSESNIILLQAPNDLSLPQMLCEDCADETTTAFLFRKLCQHSLIKWHETIDTLHEKLDYLSTFNPMVKTAYIFVKNENNVVLTSRKPLVKKTKKAVLGIIKNLLKGKKYNKIKTEINHPWPSGQIKKYKKQERPCLICYKVFSKPSRLAEHKERVHDPKTIQCAKCVKMFGSVRLLTQHERAFHTTAKCKHCSLELPSRHELEQHMYKHNKNKCLSCSKEFKKKLMLKKHIEICGVDKRINYICDICQKSYCGKNGLRIHLITRHGFGSTHDCNWCKKKFAFLSKLKQHIIKHTRERNFSCEVCGGQFVTREALTYHSRIHTGERPYPCDLCEESFLSASRRMDHKRRKHFDSKFQCNICDSKFTSKFEVNKHQARHTNPQSKLYIGKNDSKKKRIKKFKHCSSEKKKK